MPPQSQNTSEDSEEENASIFSILSFSYYNEMFRAGATAPLTMEKLPKLIVPDRTAVVAPRFEQEWNASHSLLGIFYRLSRGNIIEGAIYAFFQGLSAIASPLLVERFVQFFDDPQESTWAGVGLAFLLLMSSVVYFIVRNQGWRVMYHTGLRTNAALMSAMFRKACNLSSSAWQKQSLGQVLNMITSDTQILFGVIPHLHMAWLMPLLLIVVIILTSMQIGFISTLASVITMIIFIPINGFLARIVHRLSSRQLRATDERLRVTNDFIQGVRLAKVYTWEDAFVRNILRIRDEELVSVKRLYVVQAIIRLVMGTSPFIVMLVAFGSYWAMGLPITARVIFTTVALLNMLRAPLALMPMLLGYLVLARVVLRRLSEFLQSEEREGRGHCADIDGVPDEKEVPVGIWQADLWWKKPDDDVESASVAPTLRGVTMEGRRGQLLMIVGAVSSGKTSLLAALVGEMSMSSGHMRVPDKLAFVGQSVWLTHASLRDNILLGRPYDSDRYNMVLDACELGPDIRSFIHGDMTEIGERGITLSGGQKARVAVARAVYSNVDVYLFDDIFSAMDAHVGHRVFTKLLGQEGLLRERTVILVTNQLNLAPEADHIILLKDGCVAETGSYDSLMENKGSFSAWMNSHVVPKKREEVVSIGEIDISDDTAAEPLMSVEKHDHGSISISVFGSFLSRFGGVSLWVFFLVFSIVAVAMQVLSQLWLAVWTGGSSILAIPVLSGSAYIGIYGGLIALSVVFGAFKEILFVSGFVKGVSDLHEKLLLRIARARVEFFDTTPIGRILNRFSKDCYTIDRDLQQRMGDFVSLLLRALSTLLMLSVITYYLPLVIIPFGYWYWREQRFFRHSARELQRLDSISKSPVFTHFTEALHGLTSIHAYDLFDMYSKKNAELVDNNHRAFFAVRMASRWLDVHLSVVGAVITFSAALLAVLEKDRLGPSLGGLVLSFSGNLVAIVSMFINNFVEIETRMTSVERVYEYSTVPIEQLDSHIDPPAGWPNDSTLDVEQVSVRYRPNLPLALENVSLSVKAGERIGICGRTGSGKSTLLSALLRMVDVESGSIHVDGVDIHQLSVIEARRALFVIPQTPTVFDGTVRFNLDPLVTHKDQDLWQVLAKAQLEVAVRNMPDGLDTLLATEAKGTSHRPKGHGVLKSGTDEPEPQQHVDRVTLSAGQKQLFCLARALLRRPKIVMLDEATSSVDLETEKIILESMKTGLFDGATSIVVAHRISTIRDVDRVVVMDSGHIVEIGHPQDLLQIPDSEFAKLVQHSS